MNKLFLIAIVAALSVLFAAYSIIGTFWPAPATAPATAPAQAPTTAVVDVVDVEPAFVSEFESVDDYFVKSNPNPVSYMLGEPRFKRKVYSSKRKRLIERDGGCCIICGSDKDLEVDHCRAIVNLGDNSDANLATLCHRCHVVKTRLDKKLAKQREKRAKELRKQQP